MADDVSRPGVARGAYPERRPADDSALDRALHALRGSWVRRRGGDLRALERFAADVESRCEALAARADAELAACVPSLRHRLAGEGFADAALAETFALVREVARRQLGTPHYAVQIMAGRLLARGLLCEMATGEGKTLTATLPACAAALAGTPVHVVSANDYLASRDAEAMGPVYHALGLRVGVVTEDQKDGDLRRAAYACDVTYGTAKTFAFDYLRDRLARGREPGPHLDREEESLLLRGLCFAIVDEADSVLVDEARTPLILAGASTAPDRRRLYRRALRLARGLDEGSDFRLDMRARAAALTEAGRKRLEALAQPLGGLWAGPRRREEWVTRALAAEHLFLRDRDYIVRDDSVEIVDPLTGRPAPDRSWEQGLHQLVELKEGCPLTPEQETRARISYQQFFRRYLRLCGMTGTAREVAGELWSVYGLGAVRIPTRRPVLRRDLGVRVFTRSEVRWEAVVARVRALREAGQPVLVGTTSVAASEALSGRLEASGVPHRVLNARQDAEEAAIVAEAGEPGRVTVATSMAGRGTDVGLAAGVAERGGLHVIATQRAEAGRIDRQLFGRCARQGDPGSVEAILSLEDEAPALFLPGPLLRWLERRYPGPDPLPHRMGVWLSSLPQISDERSHARMRRELVQREQQLAELLAFSGPGE